ncbi:glycosyltransferase [Bradyrhizobium lablabi]|uniref:glycosyltransferase n=1 Tax=Bradyrhizobium lablabi TaxID=722472 RepID=UPI00090C3570|nr:glycosyltransferase [Bradyrhizobium lablabi]SHM80742.1 Glycosyltransferase involved in cell wall bisynthesis [Bradyrhizobium lablabi]
MSMLLAGLLPKTQIDDNMRVLAFNRHYLPGFKAGGPIRSLSNMVEVLGDEIEFFIGTTDRDLGDAEPFQDINTHGWVRAGKAKVRYFERQNISIRAIRALIDEVQPDSIYLNSFFDPIFSLRVLVARRIGIVPRVPLLLAPRGEFSAGALAVKSVRKLTFLKVAFLSGLAEDVTWHASTAIEARDIYRAIPDGYSSVAVAPDLGTAPPVGEALAWKPRENGRPLRICFLSRISPMKNLACALRALGLAKAITVFDIYGPIEDEAYWSECEAIIEDLPPHVRVAYCGEVAHKDVASIFIRYDLFLLPTFGENYGHVIVEALSVGLPVLTSDQTPWNDLSASGAGWAVATDDSSVAACIEEAARWTLPQQVAARASSIRYAKLILQNDRSLEQNRQLFLQFRKQ